MPPTEHDLAYWAGVFDFAGSIRWRKAAGKRTPTICLGSKNTDLLQQAFILFGGGIRKEGPYARWETTGTNAVRVITLLFPHLHKPIDINLLFWKASKRGPRARVIISSARVVQLMEPL